jgi:hypothetical protein
VIQFGYLVHGAFSHRFLCPVLIQMLSDISGFPTTIFKGIEAEVDGFFFPAASRFACAELLC